MARTEAVRARSDNRTWASERRARTRQLIELGGLVQKAGLVDLTGDDRAALLCAFLELADRLWGEGGTGLVEIGDDRTPCDDTGLMPGAGSS